MIVDEESYLQRVFPESRESCKRFTQTSNAHGLMNLETEATEKAYSPRPIMRITTSIVKVIYDGVQKNQLNQNQQAT